MNGKSSVETFMHSNSSSIGFVDSSDHMEVNSISANLESLTNISELNV